MLRRVFRSRFFLVAVLVAGIAAADAQTRRALVIGIDDYRSWPKLQKATGDAQAMKATIERLGFEVDLLLNADRRVFNHALSDFVSKLQPGDVALFHFSGHGVGLDGENYLLPTDVPRPGINDKDYLKGESFGLTSLIERIRSKVQMQILIIDACRDNPYADAGTRSFGRSVGLTRIDLPSGPGGIFIMYSAGYGQQSLDRLSGNDPEPTSVYTRLLLRKITVEGKKLTDLATEVREDVEKLASKHGHAQRPAYYDELSGGPFYFVPPRTQPTMAEGSQEAMPARPVKPAPSSVSPPSPSADVSHQATRPSSVVVQVDRFTVAPPIVSPGQRLTLAGEYSVMGPDPKTRLLVIETVITSFYDEQTQQWQEALRNRTTKTVQPGKYRFSPGGTISPPAQPPGGRFRLTFEVAHDNVSDQRSQEVRIGSLPASR